MMMKSNSLGAAVIRCCLVVALMLILVVGETRAADAPFPFLYENSSGGNSKTECEEVIGHKNWYGTDTRRQTSGSNWKCNNNQCDESAGGWATNGYRLGYYRSTYTSNPAKLGYKYAYGGRCESNPKTKFSGSGVLKAEFYISPTVISSTGVYTIALLPGYYRDISDEDDAVPSYYGDLTDEQKALGDWNTQALNAFYKKFELDLFVINLLDDGVPVIKIGQPQNTVAYPLSDFSGSDVTIQITMDVGVDHDWTNGKPDGWSDGSCVVEVWLDGTALSSTTLDNCNLAPPTEWWLVDGSNGLKAGPGGSKLVINSRARNFDPNLVIELPDGTYDYSPDSSSIVIDSVQWSYD